MREFSYPIVQDLSLGLRPNSKHERGSRFLYQCYNLRPTDHGLKPYEDVETPFATQNDIVMPFPQLIEGKKTTFLMGGTTISIVDRSTDPWTWSLKVPLVPTSGSPLDIPFGGPWHLADLGDAWYLFNGECVLFFTPQLEIFDGVAADRSGIVYHGQDTVTIKTGCEFRGRIICGGFDSSDLFQSAWTTIFSNWIETTDHILPYTDIDKNWIMWSSVGGGDLPLWLFYPGDYSGTPFDYLKLTQDNILRRLKEGMFGWMQMPYVETVRVVAPLGDHVIVYQDDGVSAIRQVVFPDGPIASTFSSIPIAHIGVWGRGAVGVAKDRHIFISKEGVLHRITPDLKIERLGYEEYLLPYLDPNTVIKHRPLWDEFVISSDEGGNYTFSKHGLSEHHQTVTGIARKGDKEVGTLRAGEDLEAYITTTEINFDEPGIKTVTSVAASFTNANSVYISVEYRYSTNDKFVRSDWIETNDEGVSFIRVSGIDFRISIRSADTSLFNLDGIEVRYQVSDRRFRRGINVSSNAARAG